MTEWFTSSFTNNGGACVQVRFTALDVQIADSKDHGTGPVLSLSGPEWDALVDAALAGTPPTPARFTLTPTPDGGQAVTVDGVTLTYTAAEWAAFRAGAADGEFTRPTATV